MTVSGTTFRNEYDGNAVTTTFTYGFRLLSDTHISIYVDGVLKTLTTHYSVTSVGSDTGSIVFVTAPPVGTANVVFVRSVPLTQETDYVENDPFPAQSHENGLDKLTMIVQQQQEEIDRAVVFPPTSSTAGITMPEPSVGKYLGWNDTATNLENKIMVAIGAIEVGASPGNVATVDQAETTVASATSIALSTTLNQLITGTTPIATINSVAGRTNRCRIQSGGFELIQSAGLNCLQTSASIFTQAGDTFDWFAVTASTGMVLNYTRSDGAALVDTSGLKNKVIGGDFTTNPWQRGETFTSLASGAHGPDLFSVTHSSTATVDIIKTADSPTVTEAGISTAHCLHADVTGADISIASGDYYTINHVIEGLNASSLGFGRVGTGYTVLTFWHKHTKTGIYCVSVRNSDQNRSYVTEYTQAVSNTWEMALIRVPVDVTGTWLYTSAIGIRLSFALAAGSSYQTTAGTWAAGNYFATANQVNALDSSANSFKIALVQFESGVSATKFESLSASAVQRECQRRYYRTAPILSQDVGVGVSTSTTVGRVNINFPVIMRSAPTALEQSGTATDYAVYTAAGQVACSSVPTHTLATQSGATVTLTTASGQTTGQAIFGRYGTANGYFGWSADL